MSFTDTPEEVQAELREAAEAAALLHETRWYDTFNAVYGHLVGRTDIDAAYEIASDAADKVHGKLL